MSVSWLGTRSPVHCTASGKVILAFAPATTRSAVLGRPLERRTPHTVTDPADLESQLREARDHGYARTFEELELGLNAVAAPVRNAAGEVVAGLDVSGPAHRIARSERSEVVARTREAADDLSHRLGYRGQKRSPSA
jgi:DNA-binding IclR family transcriptional regulator